MSRRGALAPTLSFWLPGLGQLYNGDWVKGTGLLAASGLLGARVESEYPLASLLSCAAPPSPRRLALYGAGLVVAWLWGIGDARRGARRRLPLAGLAGPR